MKKIFTIISILLITASALNAQVTIYVKADATGANNGTSWSNAFTSLKLAINTAFEGDRIWVAYGTYTSTTGVDACFEISKDIKLYGSFSGTETTLSQRVFGNEYTSILDGENEKRVVLTTNLTANAVIDGFLITGGNGGDFGIGGIWNDSSSPTLSNLSISGNIGGGICNDNASPTITNVKICGNSNINSLGGGIFNRTSAPILTNVAIFGNTARMGGGIANSAESSPTLINVTIAGNFASEYADGVANFSSTPIFQNCIIWGNGNYGVYNQDSSPAYTYCLVQEENNLQGAGNINAEGIAEGAVFVNIVNASISNPTTNGNYQLKSGSPCINTGSNSFNSSTTDLAGNPRIYHTTIDMGAYEYTGTVGINGFCAKSMNIYPNPANNYIFVDGLNAGDKISITNIAGVKLMEVKVKANADTQYIDVSSLRSGMYIIRVEGGELNVLIKN